MEHVGTVGFVYKWDGNKAVGAGEQEITGITEGERMDMELRFKRPFENNAKAFMATEALTENQTRVKWGMYGKSNYPMNFMNFMMDGMLGKDLEKSLSNLKNKLENN
jgi:hypothetical protein